mmetsp:Transcript_20417/g.43787  ORF Transcript_20417/g.43787 Transcript_20417/m.43787 type:complete len:299 (+) Transcript_20417:181-1077(+)
MHRSLSLLLKAGRSVAAELVTKSSVTLTKTAARSTSSLPRACRADEPLAPDRALRQDLAAAYRICSLLNLDDHTYTHLSARLPGSDCYYIYPFGELYEEVTAGSLLCVGLDGKIREGAEFQYNATGYAAHGAIYRARSDINAVFHTHTSSSIAVSCNPQGLLPVSQHALHFYERVAYHDYGSLIVDTHGQGSDLVKDLGDKYVMLMRNHGGLTSGRTIREALFYTYHLEFACKNQVATMSSVKDPIMPPKEMCERAVRDLLSFEKDLGKRDWQAWIRKLDRLDPSYKLLRTNLEKNAE